MKARRTAAPKRTEGAKPVYKPIRWQAVWDGEPYAFSLTRRFGEHMLLRVNDEQSIEIPVKFFGSYTDYDTPIEINGKPAHFVLGGLFNNRPDIVAEGRYLSTGAPYRPVPRWAWVFLVPLVPMMFLGALGVPACFLGLWFCTRAARIRGTTALRVLACLGVAALTWAVYLLLMLPLLDLTHGPGR